MYDVVLVRYGEIGLKGRNRPFFEGMLRRNLKGALGLPVEKARGRFIVEAAGDTEESLSSMCRVFGVVSASPAVRVGLDLEAIKHMALEVFEDSYPRGTFKVQARRSFKGFAFTTPEINAEVGAYILRNSPETRVDVESPECVISVEVRDEGAYVYSRTLPGPGGLPVGTGGRAVLLLSGGIDSPVAGWMTMKRGVEVEACHFHSFPFTGPKSRQKVEDLCSVMAEYSGRVTLHVVPFTETQISIKERCPEEIRVTIMRRMMVRISEALAKKRKALALVTGESIGQVASQTLESLLTINAVASVPVLRPLSGLDKSEIVEKARKIGTYEISIRPYEDCCSLFLPRKPKTRPTPEQAMEAEEGLDISGLVERALDGTERISFGKGLSQ